MPTFLQEEPLENNYRELHEQFISNHDGASIWENILIIAPAPICIFFSCCISSLLRNYSGIPINVLFFCVELSYLVILQILCFTYFSDFIVFVVLSLLAMYLFLLNSFLKHQTKESTYRILITDTSTAQRPYITYFRALVSILTAICILAVDFRIFPRRFAKTESFGFSLMDTGVGFFVVSNAIVIKPKLLYTGKRELLIKTILHNIPLVILGIVRLLTVESVNYQKHITEYGMHWNFFFTLAIIRIISLLITRLFPKKILFSATAIIVINEFFLTFGMKEWIISNAPRDNFLTANREGILSLPGYISLYLLGVYFGDKLRYDGNSNIKSDLKKILNIFRTFIILFLITILSYSLFNISRRLVNMTYVLWILTLSTLFVGMLFTCEISLLALFSSNGTTKEYLTPKIMEAVNYNGLIFFLLANVFTGLINISIPTLYVGEAISVVIITAYMTVLSSVVLILYEKRWKLKL